MSEKTTMISEVRGRESMRALERETSVSWKKGQEIDRRHAAGYDVVVLLRKKANVNHFFLHLTPVEDSRTLPTFMLPGPIELPPPTEKVPNRVKDGLEHPMAYYAAAGIATEAFFADHSYTEAA